jgi:GDP-L-fucose synthase
MLSKLKKGEKIYVAGHNGMVGSSIIRHLIKEKFNKDQILTATRKELDLTNQTLVNNFFINHKIKYVFMAAAKVGGIMANNSLPAEFIFKNLMIQTNIINASYKNKIKRLIFLGSSCIYPKDIKQPIKEESFMTGKLEPTNRPYAISKIAGIEMIWSYNRQYNKDDDTKAIALMPSNLYGLNDNYDLDGSHVIPGMINKFHEAKKNNKKKVTIWGTGKPLREFTFTDDLASACIDVMNLDHSEFNKITAYNRNDGLPPILNVGSGEEISISDLAKKISKIVGYDGEIYYDQKIPDGTLRKVVNSSRIKKLGWQSKVDLDKGLEIAYDSYLANKL